MFLWYLTLKDEQFSIILCFWFFTFNIKLSSTLGFPIFWILKVACLFSYSRNNVLNMSSFDISKFLHEMSW